MADNQELMRALMENPDKTLTQRYAPNLRQYMPAMMADYLKEALAYAPLGLGFRGPLSAGPARGLSMQELGSLGPASRQQIFNPTQPPARPFEPAYRVRQPDGTYRTFTGENHGIAFDKAVTELGVENIDRASGFKDTKGLGWGHGDNPFDGFVRPDGTYLTRNQAAAELRAQGFKLKHKELASEDF